VTTRRDFLRTSSLSAVAFGMHQMQSGQTMSNMGSMDESAYKPVHLPPKLGANAPSMSDEQRDELEHHIHCQCGCNLDIYTCRTTDFSCQLSPAMHRDVMSLVDGGYNKSEILSAFVNIYGEKALMAPVKQGFNWAGYFVPFAVIAVGAVVLLRNLRKWTSQNQEPPQQ
jgi:cytochrome c-type biogenesis protein CcmH